MNRLATFREREMHYPVVNQVKILPLVLLDRLADVNEGPSR
jgi:hypothetical protein